MSRAFVVVLDACGAGALPDAADYGDAGTNTLAHLAEAAGGLHLPTLERLGLGSILPLDGLAPADSPVLHGRLSPLGPGKDSTAGHWELMGVVMPGPLPRYPDGFPDEVLEVLTRASGREVICNRPYNGIEVIEDFGEEQLRTGALIVYTSQDSVLQIAAHDQTLDCEQLYEICARVRSELPGEHQVGRVIARPFNGSEGNFKRTERRRDFSIRPPSRSYLEEVHDAGVPVHTVGKTGQLFDGIGIDEQHPGATNQRALEETTALIGTLDSGLVFTNLVETDQVYGHRHDVDGFHRALQAIDAQVAQWLSLLGPSDLLVLTADHGCDVTAVHTDHTRECVPLLASFAGNGSRRRDGALSDVGASAHRWLTGSLAPELPGAPFL
jgi:phosphopentomutase